MLPGEDELAYSALRGALLKELAPGTPSEIILAENIVNLEWEAIRHRRLRDASISAEYKRITSQSPPSYTTEEAWALANSRVEYDGDIEETVALAHHHAWQEIEPHERKLADIENRSRRLHEQFDRLKSKRERKFEEAEIIEP